MHSKNIATSIGSKRSCFLSLIYYLAIAASFFILVTGCATQRPRLLGGGKKPVPICVLAVNKAALAENQFLDYAVDIRPVIVPAHLSEFARALDKIALNLTTKRRCFARVRSNEGAEIVNPWVNKSKLNKAVMEIRVPYILTPTGGSPGKIGVEVSLFADTGELLWESYGEALLQPQRWKDYIIFQDHYAPAPSVHEGFSALFENILVYLERGGA